MPIELKYLNYYSKVFKRINYRLSNNTFWVVISASLNDAPPTSRLMRLFSLQWCASHLKTHTVVLLKKNPFKGASLTLKLMQLFSSKRSFQGYVSHPQAHVAVLLKKSFQECVSHPQAHATVLLKKILSRMCLSPPSSCGFFPQKNPFKGTSLTPRLMRLFS